MCQTSLILLFFTFLSSTGAAALPQDDPDTGSIGAGGGTSTVPGVEPSGSENVSAPIPTPTTISPSNSTITCYDASFPRYPIYGPACDELFNTTLPSIMDLDQEGYWSDRQTYRWDLGTKWATAEDSCVLQLVGNGNSTADSETTSRFRPRTFIQQIRYRVLPYCGGTKGYGGQQALDEFSQFYVKVTTESAYGAFEARGSTVVGVGQLVLVLAGVFIGFFGAPDHSFDCRL